MVLQVAAADNNCTALQMCCLYYLFVNKVNRLIGALDNISYIAVGSLSTKLLVLLSAQLVLVLLVLLVLLVSVVLLVLLLAQLVLVLFSPILIASRKFSFVHKFPRSYKSLTSWDPCLCECEYDMVLL